MPDSLRIDLVKTLQYLKNQERKAVSGPEISAYADAIQKLEQVVASDAKSLEKFAVHAQQILRDSK